MTLSERERGFNSVGRGWIIRPSAMQHRKFSGTALLAYPIGAEILVHTSFCLSRSRFSVSGNGQFQCGEADGIAAFGSEEWLSLTFGGEAQIMIDVIEIRIRADDCCCEFEVKS